MSTTRSPSREAKRKPTRRERDDGVFKALANPDRRRILDHLRDGPRSTGEICEHLKGLDRCTVMLHLRVLERAELVIVRRRGRRRDNFLNVVPIQRIYARWIQGYAQPAAELLAAWSEHLARAAGASRGPEPPALAAGKELVDHPRGS